MGKKNEGKIFEDSFKQSVPADVFYLRLKDPAQSFSPNQGTKLRFSAENPYDLLIFKKNLFCLELKSTSQTSFSFETEEEYLKRKQDKKEKLPVKPNSKMIKYHQIQSLAEASKFDAVISGFIFNIREEFLNKTWFLLIQDFLRFMKETTKKSINEKDIIQYGAIEIKSELKRVRYRYDIGNFIQQFQIAN